MQLKIVELSDGDLVLECGNGGMETDLVFAEGAMRGDPFLIEQRKILEQICEAVNGKSENTA